MVRRTRKKFSQTERRKLRRDRLNRLLPNALTMLGLCCGLTAIRYGLDERWKLSVVLIAAAAVLDGLDGRMARLMGGQTELGGQLDSLVDAVSFGVAPIMIIFLCSLTYAGGVGWAISVLFVVCCVFSGHSKVLIAATLIWRRNIFLQFSCSGVMMFTTGI